MKNFIRLDPNMQRLYPCIIFNGIPLKIPIREEEKIRSLPARIYCSGERCLVIMQSVTITLSPKYGLHYFKSGREGYRFKWGVLPLQRRMGNCRNRHHYGRFCERNSNAGILWTQSFLDADPEGVRGWVMDVG